METKNERKVPFLATHPGRILQNELGERGISQKDFAQMIGMRTSHLNEIIKGKRSITIAIADKLEEALGIPSISWVNLQTQYDYDCKIIDKRKVEEIEACNEMEDYNKAFDVKTILKRLGIAVDASASILLKKMKSILSLPEPAELQLSFGMFKKSQKTGLDSRMIATWILLARYESRNTEIKGRYEKEKTRELAENLKKIFNENENVVPRLKEMFSLYGIRFNVVEKVDYASIDAYSFIENGIPAICVTKRYDRIDNLAFDVMHELGHVCLHLDENKSSIASVENYDGESIEEKEANRYAANMLIPESLWSTAPRVRMNPFVIQRDYTAWAKKNNMNKWIVLGRISKETGMYKFRSDNSRKIN